MYTDFVVVCGVEIETKAWSCAVPNDTDAIP